MPRYFISELRLEGFRGINNEGDPLVLKFKRDAVNSVFAANGLGKSSIYEALQFAFSGAVSRLEEMQLSEQPGKYLSNLFHSAGTSTIELTLAPDDGRSDVQIRVMRDSTGRQSVTSPSGHKDPEKLLQALNQDFALLDYAKFSRFIEDTALSRGRSFSSLLGLSEYGDTRRALKTVSQTQTYRADFDIATLEEKLRSQRAQLGRATSEYSERYKDVVGKPLIDTSATEEGAVEIARALSDVSLIRESIKGLALDEIDFRLIESTIARAENSDDRSRLGALLEEQQKWTMGRESFTAVRVGLAELRSALDEYDALVAETSGAMKRVLLRAAESFLNADDAWSEFRCPLCQTPLNSSVKEHVHTELDAFKAADLSQQKLTSVIEEGAFMQQIQFVEHLPGLLLDGEKRLSESLVEAYRSDSLEHGDIDAITSRIDDLEERVDSRLAVMSTDIARIEEGLPPSLVTLTAQVSNAKSALSALRSIRSTREDIDRLSLQLRVFERWKSFIGKAHDLFGSAETSLSRQILDGLREDYQEMFNGIMSVSDIIPTLTRDGSGEQLHIELENFHGREDVSARAVLSESYRNALAISVFLSAAAKYGKVPRFVVLDDITSSFDSGHQFHLMEQIRRRLQYPANPDGLQFIILSHDVTLEKYFDRLGGEPEWNHQKLHGWPPYTPMSAVKQDFDRLRTDAERFVRAGQVVQASGLIRQYLEFTLQQIIRNVNIPVPIDLAVKDHKKMVGTCIEAILTAVELHKDAGSLCMTKQQVADLTGRHAPAIVANWVNHYGTAGPAVFSPPSLLGVLSDIDLLGGCFQYDASGSGDWRFYKSLARKA